MQCVMRTTARTSFSGRALHALPLDLARPVGDDPKSRPADQGKDCHQEPVVLEVPMGADTGRRASIALVGGFVRAVAGQASDTGPRGHDLPDQSVGQHRHRREAHVTDVDGQVFGLLAYATHLAGDGNERQGPHLGNERRAPRRRQGARNPPVALVSDFADRPTERGEVHIKDSGLQQTFKSGVDRGETQAALDAQVPR